MLLEFIAAIAVGLGAAGIALVLRTLSAKKLPIWLAPASAGVAMIAFMVYMEYSWMERTEGRLPAGVIVVNASQETSWYRPWTYIKPLTLRLVAVDTRRNRINEGRPDQIMTTVILLGRWLPAREIPVVYDCAGARRADLGETVTLGADGELEGAEWRDLNPDDAALLATCQT
ncbi:MAG: hypothetical protein AAGJ52_11225 [Pseudomonadota bacterium]